MADLLPNCTLRESTGEVDYLSPYGGTIRCVRVFCANCGVEGRYTGKTIEGMAAHAYWLCDPCFETHGAPAGSLVTPDELFFRDLVDEQHDRYDRTLDVAELVQLVDDPSSWLSKLCRDRGTDKYTKGT